MPGIIVNTSASGRGASKKASKDPLTSIFQGALHFVSKGVTGTFKGLTSAGSNPAIGLGIASLSSNPVAQTALAKIVNSVDTKKNVVKKPPTKTTVKPKTTVPASQSTAPVVPIQADPDETYSWNLPPHKWSLPVDPSSIADSVTSPGDASAMHSKRRGLIFVGRKYNGNTTTVDAKTGAKITTGDTHFNKNYGFQFLWNPETFNQSTSVNWGITPNQNDKTALLTGLVTANSTLDFTLRLDRTNDFAAGKSSFKYGKLMDREATDREALAANFSKYYTDGQAPNSAADFAQNIDSKILDLMRRGTEADLEFLYRTINGDGYSLLGETTSNISFLLPTIVRIDLGPQRLIGMVQSINVTHLAFTREMVPIRTDVSLSIDLRTATAYTTSNFGNTDAEAKAVTSQ